MTEEELKAYQELKKQRAVLLRSSTQKYIVGVSTKLPNLTVMFPIRIPVTTYEYRNPSQYIPHIIKRLNQKWWHIKYCAEYSISADPTGVIIFRRN
jgi:hypothetical protein